MTLHHYLVVGAILFVLGMIGFLTRRNLIIMFLSAEMMLQGVALNLVAFARYRGNLQRPGVHAVHPHRGGVRGGHRAGLILMLYRAAAIARRQPLAGAARSRARSRPWTTSRCRRRRRRSRCRTLTPAGHEPATQDRGDSHV